MGDSSDEASRSVRNLERLAATLGLPVAAFFERGPPPSNAASPQDVADLTRAFLAITDPTMRRHCLDVVRAASTEEPADAID